MRVSSSTTAPVASDSRSRSGRFASAAAESRSESGWPRAIRSMRAASAGATPARRSSSLGLVAAEVAERQRLEQVAQRRRPGRDRLVATGQKEPAGIGDAREQHLADPVVEEREGFVVVDGEHCPCRLRAERGRDPRERARLAADLRGEHVEEASFRRLDRARVQGDDGGGALACVRGERREQGRLANTGEAMNEHGNRHVVTDEAQRGGPLAVAPDEPSRLPVEQRAERRSHPCKSTQ